MSSSKTFKYYQDYMRDRDYGSDSPEDKARYLGVRPVGTGDVLEIPYRHYWEMKKLLKLLPEKRPLRILELGCGAGRFAISLAPIASQIVAVDFSEVQLHVGMQDCEKLGIQNIKFINESVVDYTPEPDEIFDVVYFSGVSQYLSHAELCELMRKAHSYLTPEGVLIERSTIVKYAMPFVSETDSYYSIFRSPKEIIRLLSDAQFEGKEIGPSYQYLRFRSLWRIGPVRRLTKFLMRIYPSLTYHALAFFSRCYDVLAGKGTQLPGTDGGYAIHTYFKFVPKQK